MALRMSRRVALQTQDETSDVQSSQVGDEGEKKHIGNFRLLMKPNAD
jgi:hypothetical protein